MACTKKGTLFGIGVGPGDPKLLTLRAVEVLNAVDVVFAAGSSNNSYSLALNTVRDHLLNGSEVVRLDFPMTRDPDVLQRAWRDNAEQVLAALDAGKNAAFISIGDPLTYSTFGYLLRTVQEIAPETKIETIPGITAYHAAAARLNLPLVEGSESLLVVSGVSDPEDIPRLAARGDNLVVMKTYRNYDHIVDSLAKLPGSRETYSISHCGLPNECIKKDAASRRGEKMPYLSLLLAKSPKKK
jgi:precorrin-2/cobalt-factor-2 C20-methyltransferase